MPTRNVVKNYGEGQYYHVYNRGVDRRNIFQDDQDYRYFMSLMKRYLSPKTEVDSKNRDYPNYSDLVELCAFCLMPNHFHLVFYLKERQGIEKLMRSVMTSYSRYFNTKYRRLGPLFQNVFLASRLGDERYFWHITRYVHLNPIDIGKEWRNYPYSSITYYSGERRAGWLHEERFVETAEERQKYQDFVMDYEDLHETLDDIKSELARM